jgi:hypothetical protein
MKQSTHEVFARDEKVVAGGSTREITVRGLFWPSPLIAIAAWT